MNYFSLFSHRLIKTRKIEGKKVMEKPKSWLTQKWPKDGAKLTKRKLIYPSIHPSIHLSIHPSPISCCSLWRALANTPAEAISSAQHFLLTTTIPSPSLRSSRAYGCRRLLGGLRNACFLVVFVFILQRQQDAKSWGRKVYFGVCRGKHLTSMAAVKLEKAAGPQKNPTDRRGKRQMF